MAGPRHVRIFLSSPGDVAEERARARGMLEGLQKTRMFRGRVTIEVVSWDDPKAPVPIYASISPQQSVVRGIVRPSECELTICIVWGRMGTPLGDFVKPDGSPYLSGTEWEFEDSRAAGKDVLLYRRVSPVVVALDDPEIDEKRRQKELVERFCTSLKNADGSWQGGYQTYRDPDEFLERLRSDVEQIVRGLIAADEPLLPTRLLWGMWLGALVAVAPVIGFLTARMLDAGVGRSDRFGSAPWSSWPGWGMRALIPVAGTMVGLFIAITFASSVCRLAYQTEFVRRFFGPACGFMEARLRWLATQRTITLAQLIVVAHALTFALSVWYFAPFIVALSSFQTWSGSLIELSPTRQQNHSLFGYILTTELLVFWAAWHYVFTSRTLPDVRESHTAVGGGMAMMLATVCLVTLPMRTLYHNQSERVEYDSRRCYLVAEQDDRGVLFCPSLPPPRSLTIALSDPQLKRSRVLEDIFAELR